MISNFFNKQPLEIGQCLEILRKPKRAYFFFSKKANIKEKINAITRIADTDNPHFIHYLIDLLKDNNKEVRDTACNASIRLFNNINDKKDYYNQLKYCNISQNDIDFYEENFLTEQYVELLLMGSFNKDEYVRAEVAKKFAQIGNLYATNFVNFHLEALNAIANTDDPNFICHLIDFLKDRDEVIRETVCKVIIQLFKKINNKKHYYNQLRQCHISQSDLDFYENNFTEEQYIELLAISSFNKNGYVREKVINKFAQIENPYAIKFLIYRLADWVQVVREAACTAINSYKSSIYLPCFLENLPLFEWLLKVERADLKDIYNEIISFIISINRAYLWINFKKYPDKLRWLLAKQIVKVLDINEEELQLFISDKYFLIRNLVLQHFEKLNQDEINQLLSDKSAMIRLNTLYCLKTKEGFETILIKYLADKSEKIRHFARFNLQHSEIKIADLYYQNLLEGKQVLGSLSGLAEVTAKHHAEIVKPYLEHAIPKIKTQAFITLAKFEEESAYEFALMNLDSPHIRLRKLVIEYLSQNPQQEVFTKANAIYQTGNSDLKKSMLLLFSQIGGWNALSSLMIGTLDEDEAIRQLACDYLTRWITKKYSTLLFYKPQQDELEKIKELFNLVSLRHENNYPFKENTVQRLALFFYK